MVQRNVVMAVLIVWISTNLAWAYDGKFEGFGATELLENAHTARAEKPSPKITDTSASTETMLAEAKEDVGDDDSEWTILDKRQEDISLYASGNPPFVKTRLGGIYGIRKEYLGRYVDAFLGIPYAQPPLGPLRLKAPEPIYAWETPINATEFGPACRQWSDAWPIHLTRGASSCSEDCLYLNVWTPSEKSDKKRPVMAYIHGGDFLLGSASWPDYEGGLMSAFGDVIVTSMNYRLGKLGFLDAKSRSAPGNQGLLDQNLALKWIHDNIAVFGGDHEQITLFGNDAGAASVGLHILSPLSAGLFKRAILQSGSAFWKLRQTTLDIGHFPLGTQGNGKITDCSSFPRESRFANRPIPPHRDGQTLRSFSFDDGVYKGLDYGEISAARGGEEAANLIGPTYDNEFLPLNPHMSAAMGLFNDVEVLIGSNNNEGAWEFMKANHWKNFTDGDNFKAINLLKFIKNFFEEFRFRNLIGAKATEGIYYYFASNLRGNDVQHNRQFAFDFIGDFVHTCPLTYFAEALADRNVSVNYYRFAHSSQRRTLPSAWPLWVGASHMDEIPFVFGAPLIQSSAYSTSERDLSASIMDAWTSFAKTGKPVTPKGQTWPRFSRKHPDYLRISTQGFSHRDSPSKDNCNFWRTFHNFNMWQHASTMD